MFQVVPTRDEQRAPLDSLDVWELEAVIDAAAMLGWHGEVRGPVAFGGIRFVAVCGTEPFGAPGSGWLRGCLVSCANPREALQSASLMAAYSPRAVLLRDPEDIVELQLETALLDQGAVIEAGGELALVSKAGPVVQSPLQDGNSWQDDLHWQSLRDAITASHKLASVD